MKVFFCHNLIAPLFILIHCTTILSTDFSYFNNDITLSAELGWTRHTQIVVRRGGGKKEEKLSRSCYLNSLFFQFDSEYR